MGALLVLVMTAAGGVPSTIGSVSPASISTKIVFEICIL